MQETKDAFPAARTVDRLCTLTIHLIVYKEPCAQTLLEILKYSTVLTTNKQTNKQTKNTKKNLCQQGRAQAPCPQTYPTPGNVYKCEYVQILVWWSEHTPPCANPCGTLHLPRPTLIDGKWPLGWKKTKTKFYLNALLWQMRF